MDCEFLQKNVFFGNVSVCELLAVQPEIHFSSKRPAWVHVNNCFKAQRSEVVKYNYLLLWRVLSKGPKP